MSVITEQQVGRWDMSSGDCVPLGTANHSGKEMGPARSGPKLVVLWGASNPVLPAPITLASTQGQCPPPPPQFCDPLSYPKRELLPSVASS